MRERSMPIDDETLRKHGASLRALARSLVGDDHRAEDIVQEAWLTAVERPPKRRRSLSAWLSRVVRNLAFDLLARESQRGDRERAAARTESVEDARETELGFEHQESLVRALRTLREPYRTTIHLRYYRGLSPAEIAERQGVSLETVRTRLRRGLALLREKLDAAYGERDAWHAGLLALARPREAAAAPLATATTLGGVILMKKLVIGATAAGLVALAWVAAREVSKPTAVERTAAPEGSASLATPVPKVLEPAGDVAPARAVVPQREGSVSGASAPPAAGWTVVRGRLLLPDGGPATGAVVELHGWRANTERVERFGDPEAWQDPGEETADGDGAFAFRFDPHRALQFTLDASLAGHVGARWRWSEIEPGSVVDVGDVVLELAGSIRGRIVDGEGNPIEGDWGPSAESSRKAGEGREPVRRRGSFDPESAEFVIDGLSAGRVRLKAYSSGVTVHGPIVEVRAGEEVWSDIVHEGPDPARRITVRAGRLFRWRPEDESIRLLGVGDVRTATRPEGSLSHVFEDVRPGRYTVEIDDPRFETWRQTDVAPGDTVQARLRGSAGVRLVVTGAEGEAIARYGVEIAFPDPWFSPNVFDLHDVDEPLPEDNTFFVVPGDFALVLTAPGYPEQDVPVVGLKAGEIRDVVAVLSRGFEVRGRVVAAGEASPGPPEIVVQITRGRIAGHDLAPGTSRSTSEVGTIPRRDESLTADARGGFAFDELAPGEWTLRVLWGPWLVVDHTIVLEAKDIDDLEIELPPAGYLTGKVILPADISIEGVELRIVPEGIPTWKLDPPDNLIGEDGTFRYGPLPAGECRVGVWLYAMGRSGRGSGRGVSSETVRIEAGADTVRNFNLLEGLPGVIRVRVSIDGSPAFGDTVRVSESGGWSFRSKRIDSEDMNVFGPFDPGEWIVSVEAANKEWVWVEPLPAVIRSAETVDVDVRIETVPRTVTFLDRDTGAPLGNRDVRWTTGVGHSATAKGHADDEGRLELRLPRASVVFHLGPEPDEDAALVDWSLPVVEVKLPVD